METIAAEAPQYTNTVVQDEKLNEYIEDLFNDEGPFGEADCVGI